MALKLTRKPIPEFKATGNAALDDALRVFREIEVNRAADADAIESEVNARAGSSDELARRLADSEKRYDDMSQSVRKLAEKLNAFDAPLSMDAKERRQFSVGKVACALYRGIEADDLARTRGWDAADAGFEREVLQQARVNHKAQCAELQRAMGTIISETGGILIPSVPLADFIEFVREKLVLNKLGARFIPNLAGHKIPIFGLGSGVTASWYGESQEPTESAPTWKARYLEPHRLAAHARISNVLLEMAPSAVDSIVREDMAQAMAVKMENGILFGSGAEDAPLGLVKDPDVGTVTLGADGNTGGRFSIRNVPDFELVLEEANLDIGDDAGFLFHPRVKRLLKKEGVANYSGQSVDAGQPYVTPAASDAKLRELLGYNFASTTAVPTNLSKGSSGAVLTYVIYALWRQLMIGQWGGMAFRVSKETGNSSGSAFLMNQSWLVMETLVDGLLRRPDAAVVCADAVKSV